MTTTSTPSTPFMPSSSPQGDHGADARSTAFGSMEQPSRPLGAGSGTDDTQADVLSRAARGAHDTIDRVAESAAPHMKRLQEGAHTATEALHQGSDKARAMGEDWTEAVRTAVRDHPLAAVAAALVAGLVIARLTH